MDEQKAGDQFATDEFHSLFASHLRDRLQIVMEVQNQNSASSSSKINEKALEEPNKNSASSSKINEKAPGEPNRYAASSSKINEEDLEEPNKNTHELFALSYYHHGEMKKCCLVLSLLSEDYVFDKETLVQLCMALDFTGKNVPHVLHACLDTLILSGYIKQVEHNYVNGKRRYQKNTSMVDKLLPKEKFSSNISHCLKWNNGKIENVTPDPETIQHLSVRCDDINATVFTKLQHFNELKSLIFFCPKVARMPDDIFMGFRDLRVLDLSRTRLKKLPNSVRYMVNLRYLDLSQTPIEWLPDVICFLIELQTLKLVDCLNLRDLPTDLKRLTGLWYLEIDVLRQLATMPRGIGALTNLRTLSTFIVRIEQGCKIAELEHLNKLTGRLCIAMLECVESVDEAGKAALYKKKNLRKLDLRRSSREAEIDPKSFSVLDSLKPCSRLGELEISCYDGLSFPSWIGDPSFDRLTSICFFKCEHVFELPPIELLPFLKNLELVEMNSVKEIRRQSSSVRAVFPNLVKLEIHGMRTLEVWSWTESNELDFNSPIEIAIESCPLLSEIHVIQYLLSMEYLEIKKCSKLESLSDKKLADSLEELIIEDCPRMRKNYSNPGGEGWWKIEHIRNKQICFADEEEEEEED